MMRSLSPNRAARGRRALLLLLAASIIGLLTPGPIRGAGPYWDLRRCVDPPNAGYGRLGSMIIIDYAALDPAYQALSFDQKLDHVAASPNSGGVLLGVAGQPVVHVATDDPEWSGLNVTDFPFVVRDRFGVAQSRYRADSTITLRVPGGCTPELVSSVEPSPPDVETGDELFALVGGNSSFNGTTDSRVEAFPASNVFEVRHGIVYGQHSWSTFSEPLPAFEQHFRR